MVMSLPRNNHCGCSTTMKILIILLLFIHLGKTVDEDLNYFADVLRAATSFFTSLDLGYSQHTFAECHQRIDARLHYSKLFFIPKEAQFDKGVKALAKLLQGTFMTAIGLYYSGMRENGILAIAQVLKRTEITTLDLSFNDIGDKGIIALAEVLQYTKITSLDLSATSMGNEGIMKLANVIDETHVTTLKISSNEIIGVLGVNALAKILSTSRIVHLELARLNIGYDGAVLLAHELHNSHITHLNLAGNQLDNDGSIVIAKSLCNTSITHLCLNDNFIRLRGIKIIAQYLKYYSNITSLDVGNNPITDKGVISLSEALRCTNITDLYLDGIKIGKKAIVEVLKVSSLAYLSLRRTSLDTECIEIILNTSYNIQLTHLNIDQNRISSKGAEQIASALRSSAITYLSLASNEIGDRGIIAIADVLRHSSIIFLNLALNGITRRGCGILANSLIKTHLTTLSLDSNHIGNEGVMSIANVLKHTQITNLYLNRVGMSTQGAYAIASVLKDTHLTSIGLFGNDIDTSACDALMDSLNDSLITKLEIERCSVQIQEILIRNELKVQKIYHQFKRLVTSYNGTLNFDVENGNTNRSEFKEFTDIISMKKYAYISHFVSQEDGNYTKNSIEDFILNIENRFHELSEQLRNCHHVHQSFDNFNN